MISQFLSPVLDDWRSKNQYPMWLDLEEKQWLTRGELKKVQFDRLKPLLIQAFEATTYYKNLFTQINLNPYQIESLEDLLRVPLLTKKLIQTHVDDLLAKNVPTEARFKNATGGSTGMPLVFYRDYLGESWNVEAANRFRRWIGYIPQDKIAFIWGAERDIPLAPETGQRWLNSFRTTPKQINEFIVELENWKPRSIRGYASSLYLVAKYILENMPDVARPLAGSIESSAEKLWDWQRGPIEEAFGCKIFDMYGSREAPCLACECGLHTGLHVFDDLRIVEIIREEHTVNPGEVGSIVVTDLLNYAMPMIRYKIGDSGYLLEGNCSCGRGFMKLGEVKGRTTSIITTPSGKYIHGEYFTHLFYNLPGVIKFQVHQKTLEIIEIFVVTTSEFKPERMNELVSQIIQYLGSGVDVSWKEVEVIPPAISGKFHFTISDVPINF